MLVGKAVLARQREAQASKQGHGVLILGGQCHTLEFATTLVVARRGGMCCAGTGQQRCQPISCQHPKNVFEIHYHVF